MPGAILWGLGGIAVGWLILRYVVFPLIDRYFD